MDKALFTGGCLCGSIRFEAATPPHNPHYCHCRMCQRMAGAPAMAWVNFLNKAFRFIGEPAWYQSSPTGRRGFCPHCGSSLASVFDDDPYMCVPIPSLDSPEAITPAYHIFTESQLNWFVVKDGLPQKRRYE